MRPSGEARKWATASAVTVWAALVAAAGSCAPGAEATPEKSVSKAVRRLQVHRITCKPGMAEDDQRGMSVVAKVEAMGLAMESMRVELRLRYPDGRPVRTVAGAEDWADRQGRFFMATYAPVWGSRVGWPALTASVPYSEVLDLPGQGEQRLIASFCVACRGLSSVSEAEFTLPSKIEVRRALRLLAIDLYPDTVREEGQPAHEDRKPAALRGLVVWAYVEAVGLEKARLAGCLRLYRADGKPVLRVSTGGRPSQPLESRATVSVSPDQAQILHHFVPHSEIDLPPGKHRLLVRYTVRGQGLVASLDEMHILSIPAADSRTEGKPVSDP